MPHAHPWTLFVCCSRLLTIGYRAKNHDSCATHVCGWLEVPRNSQYQSRNDNHQPMTDQPELAYKIEFPHLPDEIILRCVFCILPSFLMSLSSNHPFLALLAAFSISLLHFPAHVTWISQINYMLSNPCLKSVTMRSKIRYGSLLFPVLSCPHTPFLSVSLSFNLELFFIKILLGPRIKVYSSKNFNLLLPFLNYLLDYQNDANLS